MTRIWRRRLSESPRAASFFMDRKTRAYRYLLLGLACVVPLPGCAWVRARAQHRSEECNQLCDKAAAARQAGRQAHADALLNAALKKSPQDGDTQRQLADSLWEAGRLRESVSILERLAEEHPRDSRLATLLAERMIETGSAIDALERLNLVLSADPHNTRALELKARIEVEQGDFDAALASYQKLCYQKTMSVSTLLALGDLYLTRHQPDRAAPLFRMAIVDAHATPEDQLVAQWRLGVAYFQAERWSEAADQLSRAAPRRTMNADDWHMLAVCQFRSGDPLAARYSLNDALNLQPNHLPSRELATLMQQQPSPAHATARLAPVNFEDGGLKHTPPQ